MAVPMSVAQTHMRFSISNARLHTGRREFAESIVNYLAVLRTLGANSRQRYADEFLEALHNYIRWETNRARIREVLNAASSLYESSFGILRIWAEWLFSDGDLLTSMDKFRHAMTVAETQQQWLHAAVSVENVKSNLVDAWHWRMINDERRNKAFANAIARASKRIPQAHLLDVGAGSGIFGVLASRYCDVVSACECDPVMHDVARSVFELNNVNVRLCKTHSSKLNLNSRVDILVSETVDSGVFGERIVSTMLDAHARLLAPNHIIIPQKATMMFSLLEATDIARDHHFEINDNVIVSQGCYTPGTSHESLPTSPYTCAFLKELPSGYRLLSQPVVGLSVDFENVSQLSAFATDKFVTEVVLQATEEGMVHAVAAWFRLQIYEDIGLCTDPEENLCWQQVVFPFYPPRPVSAGEKLRFEVFVRDEKLHVNPRGPPPEKQVLKGPDLDFSSMHDANIRGFFRNSLAKGNYRSALDCTDLLVQDGTLNLPVTVASKRSSIRYVSDNAMNLNNASSEEGGAILYWPLTIQGIDDDYMISIIETHLRSCSAVLIPSDIVLKGCLVSSAELFQLSQLSRNNSVHMGVDLSPMNAYQASYFHEIETSKLTYDSLSESAELLRLNFSHVEWDLKQLSRVREHAHLSVTQSGEAHALLYWYEVSDPTGTCLSLLSGSGYASAFIFPQPRNMLHLTGARAVPVLSSTSSNLCRHISTTASLAKNKAGKYKSTIDRSQMLTYEMAQKPHHIGVRKAWLTWHTQNLEEFRQMQGVAVAQDQIIRRFILGFFPHNVVIDGTEASRAFIVVKKRGNLIFVTGFMHYSRRLEIRRLYWMFGFAEELLSHLMKQPVKLEFQFVPDEKELAYNWV